MEIFFLIFFATFFYILSFVAGKHVSFFIFWVVFGKKRHKLFLAMLFHLAFHEHLRVYDPKVRTEIV